MPGTPFMYTSDSYQGVAGEGTHATGPGGSGASVSWGFWLWLIIIGVVIPAVVLGGLRAGGFQFVFRRR